MIRICTRSLSLTESNSLVSYRVSRSHIAESILFFYYNYTCSIFTTQHDWMLVWSFAFRIHNETKKIKQNVHVYTFVLHPHTHRPSVRHPNGVYSPSHCTTFHYHPIHLSVFKRKNNFTKSVVEYMWSCSHR